MDNKKSIPRFPGASEDVETLQLLRAIRSDIAQVLAPEVTSPMAKMVAHMAGDILTFLIGQAERSPDVTRQYLTARGQALREVLSLDQALGAVSAEARQWALAAITLAAQAEPAGYETARRQIDGVLESILYTVLQAAQAAPDLQAKANETVRGIIEATAEAESSIASRAKAEIAADAAMRRRVQATVTAERLQSYWRARFPDRPHARITALRELAGGFAKTTILFDVADWEEEPASLVMRRDVLGGATEVSVIDEYQVLRTAHDHGLPVPEILFLEADLSKLDRAFIVMRKADGEPAGDLWRPSPGCTAETGYDLARALARLHAIDPAEFGITLQGSPQQQAKEYLFNWRRAFQKKQAEPDPVMEAALCWVEQNMPALPQRLSYVHGDPGFWNILIDNGRITALLDWELGHVGDPAEDISYVKPFIEVFMPWQDFLNAYKDAGGGEYEEDRGAYYAIWRDVRNAICSAFAGHAFSIQVNPELRMAHCGIVSYRMLLMRAAENIRNWR